MAEEVKVRELIDANDRWMLGMSGCTVMQCRVDYAFTLMLEGLDGVFEIRIEQPFELLQPAADHPLSIEVASDPTAAAPALGYLHAEVKEGTAFKNGLLELTFVDGKVLRVPASEEFEAWTLVGPNGLRLVSSPGGDVAVWMPGPPPGDSPA